MARVKRFGHSGKILMPIVAFEATLEQNWSFEKKLRNQINNFNKIKYKRPQFRLYEVNVKLKIVAANVLDQIRVEKL